ncbi:MAG TPA: NAD(P)H-dependent oxidoreductase [Phototrophicaceae bacterium]|nr:NAD(P)H-dependent oxidoreductase [Phototrophicaceae bacterium]
MSILVLWAHPRPGSFSHAIAETAVKTLHAQGYETIGHDLYAEQFDSRLLAEELPNNAPLDNTLHHHIAELTQAEGIIVIHPNWWGMPPAILTGYIDRVFRAGAAYRFLEGDSGEGVPVGLLRAQTAIVFTTSNTSDKREQAVFGDPLETIWKNCIFGLCGVSNFYRRNYSLIVTSTPEQRQNWLKDVADTVARFFPPIT